MVLCFPIPLDCQCPLRVRLMPYCRLQHRVELYTPGQLELFAHILNIPPDLLSTRHETGPIMFGRPGQRVDMNRHVAGQARVLVCEPCSPNALLAFVDGEIDCVWEVQLMEEFVGKGEPGEACTNADDA